MTMRRILVILIAIAASIAASAQRDNTAQLADSAYNTGQYAQAVRLYHQAISDDGPTAELCYNLGNSYYRIGKLGRAVLYYRRALNIDPSMKQARENLEFVNTQILDKPEDDSSFLGNLHRSISSALAPNTWAWLSFAFFALTLGCIALYAFSSTVPLRKFGFFGGMCLAAIFIYALVIAAQTSSAYSRHNYAVVIPPTSNLSTSPGNTGENAKIIPLHEGTVVEIVDSMAIPGQSSSPMWYNVKINNSTKAWARSADLEII